MTKRFVSWVAVSSLPQAKKISLDDQLKTNREHIARHDGQLVAELVVPGESRNIVLLEEAAKRIEAYAKLRDLIAERAFDVLIYLDRSRLGRKASLSMTIVELCHEAGIITYEVESPPATLDLTTSHDDMLIGAIKSVGAQREIAKLQERHRMGMIDRTRRGKLPGGVPWGYVGHYAVDLDGKRILQGIDVDPDVAPVIRTMMLDWYLVRGWGWERIGEELNALGVRTPQGVFWQKHNVQAIFRRVWRYAGWSEINRLGNRPYTKARGNWTAILTDSEARAVETERERRRSARRSVSDTYLFSGCVWCAECGRRMIMATHVRNRPSKHVQKSLCCKSRHEHRFISENKVAHAMRAAVEFVQDEANWTVILDADTDHRPALQQQIADIEAQIERARSGLHRADDAFTAGTMDAERYRRQVTRLDAQIADYQAKVAQLQETITNYEHAAGRADRLRESAEVGMAMLEHTDIQLANAWLRGHFKIWAQGNQVVRVDYL